MLETRYADSACLVVFCLLKLIEAQRHQECVLTKTRMGVEPGSLFNNHNACKFIVVNVNNKKVQVVTIIYPKLTIELMTNYKDFYYKTQQSNNDHNKLAKNEKIVISTTIMIRFYNSA